MSTVSNSMSSNSNEKTIGDATYTFGTIPPIESVVVQVAIVKVLGEPLFKAFMGIKDGKEKGQTEAEEKTAMEQAGAAAIGLLAKGLSAEDLVDLLKRVFVYVTVTPASTRKTVRVNIDEHFMGKNLDLWKVLLAALTYNFKDFFPASLFDSIAKKAKALAG